MLLREDCGRHTADNGVTELTQRVNEYDVMELRVWAEAHNDVAAIEVDGLLEALSRKIENGLPVPIDDQQKPRLEAKIHLDLLHELTSVGF